MMFDDAPTALAPMELIDLVVPESALPLSGARVLIVAGEGGDHPARLTRRMMQVGCSVTVVLAADEALALLRIGYRPGVLVLGEGVSETTRAQVASAIERATMPGAVTVLAVSPGVELS
jgi:hypothetical protein